MTLIELDESPSTNTYLSSIASTSAHGTVVTARSQTAGRGQRGNSWESEPGANITMSILLRPDELHPSRQFLISEAVSLAVTEVLRRYLTGHNVSIKWPNDIYVGDRKICGILIENVITPQCILHSVAGLGINVNQERFLSDAPNPVSMRQLTGESYDVAGLTREIADAILAEISALESPVLHRRYLDSLWRREGLHPYRDAVRGENVMASIADVAPDGILSLRLKSGEVRKYAFKEVVALLG